jgi:hypothetical protein
VPVGTVLGNSCLQRTRPGMSMNKVVLGMARDADVQSARVHDPHRWLSFSRFTFAFLNHL